MTEFFEIINNRAQTKLKTNVHIDVPDDCILSANPPRSMTDILIQDTGRFCEDNQSDLLSILSYIQYNLNTAPITGENSFFVFGIHQHGVDDNEYVIEKALSHSTSDIKVGPTFTDTYYNKIYGISIEPDISNGIMSIKFKDIKQEVSLLCKRIALYGKDTVLSGGI